MSRVDASKLAVWKANEAGLPLKDSVVASDAFFPFPDGVVVAAEAGATAVIQPGGSMRDPETIVAANDRNMAMIFTGIRHSDTDERNLWARKPQANETNDERSCSGPGHQAGSGCAQHCGGLTRFLYAEGLGGGGRSPF